MNLLNEQFLEWVEKETATLVQTDFARLHEDARIGCRSILAECRAWMVSDLPFSLPTTNASLSLEMRQQRIFDGLRAHSRALLSEWHGLDVQVTVAERSWVEQSQERLFAALVSEFDTPKKTKLITHAQMTNVIDSMDKGWRPSHTHSDESTWAYEQTDGTVTFLLSFFLAGHGNMLGYRVGYISVGPVERPITYDRLVGLPGFVLMRDQADILRPAIASILVESEMVIRKLTQSGSLK